VQNVMARDLTTGNLVEPGMAVGVIAAQSIGEPGTTVDIAYIPIQAAQQVLLLLSANHFRSLTDM